MARIMKMKKAGMSRKKKIAIAAATAGAIAGAIVAANAGKQEFGKRYSGMRVRSPVVLLGKVG